MNDSERHPIDLLAEEFSELIRAGESPSVEEFAARFPEQRELLLQILPTILMVEKASQSNSNHPPQVLGLGRLKNGTVLGDFRILREVGRGGMGIVYEAIQQSLKRRVALKVVRADHTANPKIQERFKKETEAAARLHHTHIVPVFGVGECEGMQFYAMQFIDGVSLDQVLRELSKNPTRSVSKDSRDHGAAEYSAFDRSGVIRQSWASSLSTLRRIMDSAEAGSRTPSISNTPIGRIVHAVAKDVGSTQSIGSNTDEALIETASFDLRIPSVRTAYVRAVVQLVADVSDAIEFAHGHGVLHRDIKPGNMLLDQNGSLWITDFGLARLSDGDQQTQAGEVIGTFRYMAPEQWSGEADTRTDIYSLGVSLYELLSVAGDKGAEIETENRTLGPRELVDLGTLVPELPLDLCTIVSKATAFEPKHRYQTAGELRDDLQRFLDDRPILARRVWIHEKLVRWGRRNPAIAALSMTSAVLMLIVLGLLGTAYYQSQSTLSLLETEYRKTSVALSQKSEALSQVELEKRRAETNLTLAKNAFDGVIENISSRGGTEALLSEAIDDPDMLAIAEASLSEADVALLENLLSFFDELAKENDTDLTRESAEAMSRVGDIQQRLGMLVESQKSYRKALESFRRIAEREPADQRLLLSQATVLFELVRVSGKQGEIVTAIQFQDQVRRLIASNSELSKTAEARFILARALNSLASIGAKFSGNLGVSARRPNLLRTFVQPSRIWQPLATRARRESQANREAIEIFRELTDENPQSITYQVSLARALRDDAAIARMLNEWPRADQAVKESIEVLQKLLSQKPDSPLIRFELASTLSTDLGQRPLDAMRFSQAKQICEELIASAPNVPEYRALQASILTRMANAQFVSEKFDKAEATLLSVLEIQNELVKDYADTIVYRISEVQTRKMLADLYVETKRPSDAQDQLRLASETLRSFRKSQRLGGLIQNFLNRIEQHSKSIEEKSKAAAATQ